MGTCHGKRVIHICRGKDEIIFGRVGKDGVGWEAMGSFILEVISTERHKGELLHMK